MGESRHRGVGGEMVAMSGRTPNETESVLWCVDNQESLLGFELDIVIIQVVGSSGCVASFLPRTRQL